MSTLGFTGAGTTAFNCTPDYKRGYRVELTEAATFTQIPVWCSCDATGADNIRGMIYSDNAGSPDALLGTTDDLVVAAGSSKAKRYLTFSTQPYSAAAWVWIFTQAETGKLNLYYDIDAYVNGAQAADAWSDGPEDPCGAFDANHRKYAFSADYRAGANSAPNTPVITSPSTGGYVSADDPVPLTWTFSDPDTGDYQTEYYVTVHEGVVVKGSEHAISGDLFYTMPTAWFVAGHTYTISLLVTDSAGADSGFRTITVDAVSNPAAPTITDPIVNQVIETDTYTVVYTAANQVNAQARTVADNAGSPNTAIVYQTVEITGAVDRSALLDFDVNNRTEHVQVRREYPAGVWSAWATCLVVVTKEPPATPTVVATADQTNRRISVTATHPAPAGPQPIVTSEDIYRRQYNVATAEYGVYVNGVWTANGGIRLKAANTPAAVFYDCFAASGITYQYQVVGLAANGTSTASTWTA